MSNEYVWDGRTQRYRDKNTGRFVKNETVLNLVEVNIEAKSKLMRSLLQDVISGKKDFITYQVESLEVIKTLHAQQYLLAKGGFKQTTPEDYLAIARDLKTVHYPAFKEFIEDLRNGNLTEAQALARTQGFARASYQSYQYGLKSSAIQNGLAWGKRYLDYAAIHCGDCPIYAAQGPVPIESIILPGTRCDCVYNCRCRVRYFKTKEEAIAG